MAQKKAKKIKAKVRDLKPKKDAKGRSGAPPPPHPSGPGD